MPCKKCGDTKTFRGLPCMHCAIDNKAIDLRRQMYGFHKCNFALVAYKSGTSKPLTACVLSQVNNVSSLHPGKRAVLAQDTRRCLRAMAHISAGTAQGRVLRDIHKIAFDAAAAACNPVHGNVYCNNGVRYCKANLQWTMQEVKADQKEARRIASESVEKAGSGGPVPILPGPPPDISVVVSLFTSGGLSVRVVFDVEVAGQMVNGDEFWLSDHAYHFPANAGEWTNETPVKVDGHGQCQLCDEIKGSQTLKDFKANILQASVKVEESEGFKLRRSLKELHQKLTGDPGPC